MGLGDVWRMRARKKQAQVSTMQGRTGGKEPAKL
jgi:hypothetical protein